MAEEPQALGPPPRAKSHAELPPILDPPYRNDPPPPPSGVDDWQPLQVERAAAAGAKDARDSRALLESARAYPEAAALLEGKECLAIGASLLENKRGESGPPTLLHVFYD